MQWLLLCFWLLAESYETINHCPLQGCGVGAGVGVVRNRIVLGGVGVGFLTTLEVGVGFFCSTTTPVVQLDNFYITLVSWEFLLKWYNFFWNFAVHHDPLILTAKFNSLYVKESESRVGVGNFGKSESEPGVGVGYFTSDSATLPIAHWSKLPYLSMYRHIHISTLPAITGNPICCKSCESIIAIWVFLTEKIYHQKSKYFFIILEVVFFT